MLDACHMVKEMFYNWRVLNLSLGDGDTLI